MNVFLSWALNFGRLIGCLYYKELCAVSLINEAFSYLKSKHVFIDYRNMLRLYD